MALPNGNVSPYHIFQHYKFKTIHKELCRGATHPLVSPTGFCMLRIVDNPIYQKLTFPPTCYLIGQVRVCPPLQQHLCYWHMSIPLAQWSGVSPSWYGRGVQCRHEYTVRWWGGGRWSIVAWIHHRVNVDVLPYKMQYHTSRGRCLELGGTGRG